MLHASEAMPRMKSLNSRKHVTFFHDKKEKHWELLVLIRNPWIIHHAFDNIPGQQNY